MDKNLVMEKSCKMAKNKDMEIENILKRSWNAQMILCVSLLGIMENSINCRGKVMEFDYQISVETLHSANR